MLRMYLAKGDAVRVQFSDGTTGTIWAESRSELVFDFPNTERFKREKLAFKTDYAKSEITPPPCLHCWKPHNGEQQCNHGNQAPAYSLISISRSAGCLPASEKRR